MRSRLSMFHFFIAEIRLKAFQLLPSSIILELFSKRLKTTELRKLTLARFNFKNILSSLALETGTVNNNLINYGTLFQALLLGVTKILRRVTSTKLRREKSPLCMFYSFVPWFQKIGNRYFHPNFF